MYLFVYFIYVMRSGLTIIWLAGHLFTSLNAISALKTVKVKVQRLILSVFLLQENFQMKSPVTDRHN